MRRLSRPIIMLAALVPVVTSTPRPRVHVNLTPSLPRGMYVETSEPLTKGVLVIECLPPELAAFAKERGYLGSGDCPGHVGSVLKRIEGLPGNRVELANEYVAINDRLILISQTLKKDAEGRELPRIARRSFVLGPDEYFLMADHSRSWDDRYKGPTARQNIRATVRPWLTESSDDLE
jgi:conjugative transfer signal peptidase TraF